MKQTPKSQKVNQIYCAFFLPNKFELHSFALFSTETEQEIVTET